MTKEQLEQIKAVIVEKRDQLRQEADRRKTNQNSSTSSGEHANYSFHMADQGSDTMEMEQKYIFASREGNFLFHLEMALERLQSGEYGICIQCKKEIGFERLLAVPHARLCIKCKAKEERTKRMRSASPDHQSDESISE
ncbi:MAG TPA: TraR/DksA family transcriptional regulator [bacterium]|nr:TraR/DksA family transcriptional regulator [bacterium]HNT65944.1 TraR/DksA family transcriptional regulator [bacterium]HOX86016.1 TraR/DksA family transcriptional regulator [bacterium]HPG45001.1 TraR/DksA family transcriptional regulator [bacterium]HPM97243.1 TraR/DksA family transcriptional regulator [bacterium]